MIKDSGSRSPGKHKVPPGSLTMIDNTWLYIQPVLLIVASSVTVPNFNSSSQNAASWLFFTLPY